MMMPSIVSAERVRFTFSARSAMRELVSSFFMAQLRPSAGSAASASQVRGGVARMFDSLVLLQSSVFEVQRAAARNSRCPGRA